MNPDWNALLPFCSLRVALELPPELGTAITESFFPNDLDLLDVSQKSEFKYAPNSFHSLHQYNTWTRYAQELRELMPSECQKGFLTHNDVHLAFMKLGVSYIRRTPRLQSYGNRMFRYLLTHHLFRTATLPAYLQDLVASSQSDAAEVAHWSAVEELLQEQDDVASPGEGVLLRTATTTAEVLAQPLGSDVLTSLKWEDKTLQLCHCLLLKLFGRKPLAQGSRVAIHGMKTEWLNGAEGTLGDLHPNGRYWVHLDPPKLRWHRQWQATALRPFCPRLKISHGFRAKQTPLQ